MNKVRQAVDRLIASQDLVVSQRKYGILIIPSPAALIEIKRRNDDEAQRICKHLDARTRPIPFRLQDWYRPDTAPPYPAYTKKESTDVTIADLAPTLQLAVKNNKTLSKLCNAVNRQTVNREINRVMGVLRAHETLLSKTGDLHYLVVVRDDVLDRAKERASDDLETVIAHIHPASQFVTTAILELEFHHAMTQLREIESIARSNPQALILSPDMASEMCALQDWGEEYQKKRWSREKRLQLHHVLEHVQELVLRERLEQEKCLINRASQTQTIDTRHPSHPG